MDRDIEFEKWFRTREGWPFDSDYDAAYAAWTVVWEFWKSGAAEQVAEPDRPTWDEIDDDISTYGYHSHERVLQKRAAG